MKSQGQRTDFRTVEDSPVIIFRCLVMLLTLAALDDQAAQLLRIPCNGACRRVLQSHSDAATHRRFTLRGVVQGTDGYLYGRLQLLLSAESRVPARAAAMVQATQTGFYVQPRRHTPSAESPTGVWMSAGWARYRAGIRQHVVRAPTTKPRSPALTDQMHSSGISSSINYAESPSAECNNGPAYDDGNIDLLPCSRVPARIGDCRAVFQSRLHRACQWHVFRNRQFSGDANTVSESLVGIVVKGNVIFSSTVSSGSDRPQ